MTDVFILNRLNEFCEKINEIYCYKSYCTIISMAPFLMDLMYDKNYRLSSTDLEKIKFCRLIMRYYFSLEKLINDGSKFIHWKIMHRKRKMIITRSDEVTVTINYHYNEIKQGFTSLNILKNFA